MILRSEKVMIKITLPDGAVLHQQEITLRGLCPHCASPKHS